VAGGVVAYGRSSAKKPARTLSASPRSDDDSTRSTAFATATFPMVAHDPAGCESGIRYVHFQIAARRRSVDGVYYKLHVGTQVWPLLLSQHNNRNPAAREILLIA